MQIVIIGTGNTATVLGRRLKGAGHDILQIYGRNAKAASELAYELDSESTNYWSVVYRTADFYLLAVSDIAIEEVVKELGLQQSTVVHTAASVSKSVLKQIEHHGVFYPLQSLKKETLHQPDIPIIIDASDEETLAQLELLAHTITDKVVQANDTERLKLHVAAVFCNNFVNHLYVLMQHYCTQEGLSFDMLLPLIKETAGRISAMPPAEAQTGPALRFDESTIEKHLKALATYPELQRFYTMFTRSIQKQSLEGQM